MATELCPPPQSSDIELELPPDIHELVSALVGDGSLLYKQVETAYLKVCQYTDFGPQTEAHLRRELNKSQSCSHSHRRWLEAFVKATAGLQLNGVPERLQIRERRFMSWLNSRV